MCYPNYTKVIPEVIYFIGDCTSNDVHVHHSHWVVVDYNSGGVDVASYSKGLDTLIVIMFDH